MVQKCPATTSIYADQGTVAHHIGALCLTNNFSNAAAYKGRVFTVINSVVADLGDDPPKLRGQTKDIVSTHEVDDDMIDAVNAYVSAMRNFALGSEMFLVEHSLDISSVTGEEGAKGTADALVLKGTSLQIHDYKHGKGKKVYADSAQLAIYGLAALEFAEFVGFEPQTVHCFIHQPRLRSEPDQHVWQVADLRKYGIAVRQAADVAFKLIKEGKEASGLNPGSEQCHFCDAKSTCPALRKDVAKAAFNDFDALVKDTPVAMPAPESEEEWLALSLEKVEMVRTWCDAVEAEAYRRAINGIAVPRFKVVQGKEGNRAWKDEAKVLAELKFLGEEAYTKKLITPPAAEKLLKKDKPPVWEALQEHISRPPGKLTLVPETDNRPAFAVGLPADDFDTAT